MRTTCSPQAASNCSRSSEPAEVVCEGDSLRLLSTPFSDSSEAPKYQPIIGAPLLQNEQDERKNGGDIKGSKRPPYYGLLMYATSTFFSTAMATFAKVLTQHHIPVFEVVLARSMFLMMGVFLTSLFRGERIGLGNRRWLLLLRGVLGFGAVSSMYWAASLLPLGDATALSFLAPAVAAITSPLLLREAPSKWTLLSLPVCLTGVVMVAQPTAIFHGQALNHLGVLVGCSQAAFSAGAKMCVRALRGTESDLTIMSWMAVVSTIGSGFLMAVMPSQHPRAPTRAEDWVLLMFGVGACGMCNQVTMTQGMRHSPGAVPAISLSYLSMVWALLLGVAMFNERPGGLELGGSAVIIAATLAVSIYEIMTEKARKKKQQKLKQADEEQGQDRGRDQIQGWRSLDPDRVQLLEEGPSPGKEPEGRPDERLGQVLIQDLALVTFGCCACRPASDGGGPKTAVEMQGVAVAPPSSPTETPSSACMRNRSSSGGSGVPSKQPATSAST